MEICEITKDTMLEKMLERGIGSEEVYNEGRLWPSKFLIMGIGFNLKNLVTRINKEINNRKTMLSMREEDEKGMLEVQFRGFSNPKILENGNLYFRIVIYVKLQYGSKKIEKELQVWSEDGIGFKHLKLRSTDTEEEVVYTLGFGFKEETIEWVLNKLPLVTNEWKMRIFRIVSKILNASVVLHTMSFPKTLEIPGMQPGDDPVEVKAPIPKAKNLHWRTNPYYQTLVIGWTAGTVGIRADDVKQISRSVYRSSGLASVVAAPNFLYNEAAKMAQTLIKASTGKVVKARTVLVGSKNVYGLSIPNIPHPEADIKNVTVTFTSGQGIDELSMVGGLAKVEAQVTKVGVSVDVELGFCIGQFVSSAEERDMPSAEGGMERKLVQDIHIVATKGYHSLDLNWYHYLLLVGLFAFNAYFLFWLNGTALRELGKLDDNRFTIVYPNADMAAISGFYALRTPHLGKQSSWLHTTIGKVD